MDDAYHSPQADKPAAGGTHTAKSARQARLPRWYDSFRKLADGDAGTQHQIGIGADRQDNRCTRRYLLEGKNAMNTDRLTALAISDTGFIFDPTTGEAYFTNQAGIDILNALKSGLESGAIIDQLQAHYVVTESEAESDVEDFIRNLRHYHLIG